MRKTLLVLTTTTALCLASMPSAVAQQKEEESVQPRQPIYERFQANLSRNHDRGGLVRVELGAAYASQGESSATDVAGVGIIGQLAVGWLPWRQTAVHLTTWGLLGRQILTVAAGPGVTYWFGDGTGGLFASMSIGVATLSDRDQIPDQYALATEMELGISSWTGAFSSMGVSIVGAAEGVNLDGDAYRPEGWRIGLRGGVIFN